MTSKTVLITGATGYIAQHIVDKLLARGYSVVGTVRPHEKHQLFFHEFRKKYPEAKLTFEIIPDVSAENALDEVFKNHPEVTAVIHTASPVPLAAGNKPLDEAYLEPAVNGTLNVLKATKLYAPQVTNVILTSSSAAVMTGVAAHVHTNESWNPVIWERDVTDEYSAYGASKKYAERAARAFVKENKVKFKFATVNPPFVFGPQVFDSTVGPELNSSNEVITQALHVDKNSTKPELGTVYLAIDVRDVAEFHIMALENEKVADQRLFICAGSVVVQTILNIINENIPELRGKVALGDPSSDKEFIEKNGAKYSLNNLFKVIGSYEFISIRQSVIDVLRQYYRVNKTV